MKNQKRAVLLASFVVLFWATVATAFKIALAGMPALTLLLIASITALLVCMAELAYRGKLKGAVAELKSFSVTKRSLWQGFMNPFVYYLILFEGYSLLPAQIAQPLNFSWQVVLIILMAIFMKQKIRLMQAIGVLVSFGGIIMLSMNNSADLSGSLSVPGLLLIMASTVIWAVYWMLKIDKSSDPVVELFHNFLAGSVFLIAAFILFPSPMPETKPFLAAVYAGFFEMGITFILWNRALNMAENRVTVTQMIYLAPLLSFLLIHLILGEKIGVLTFGGLFLIIGGILLSNTRNKRGKERDRILADKK